MCSSFLIHRIGSELQTFVVKWLYVVNQYLKAKYTFKEIKEEKLQEYVLKQLLAVSAYFRWQLLPGS